MFILLSTFSLTLILFLHQSVGQSLPYTFGYRSAFKFHGAGNMNLIISAPHGGNETPADVPDRTRGGCLRRTGSSAGRCTWFYNDTCSDGEVCEAVLARDPLTDLFAENVANELFTRWGLKPFVVIGVWRRSKVEYNREINQGTLNYPEAMTAYQGYHSFISQSVDQINRNFGPGLLIDIHGHSVGNFTMGGYLLTGTLLSVDDLNTLKVSTSLDLLCKSNRNECIRGPNSFGTLLENKGLGVVYPSLANPKPGNFTFYEGGYITSNYISRINAIQTELPPFLTSTSFRAANARSYAEAIVQFMQANNFLKSSAPMA